MRAAEQKKRSESTSVSPAEIGDQGRRTPEPDREVRLYHFLLPLATLIGFTLWYELDVQIGVIASVTVTILLFGAQRRLAWTEMLDAVLDGIKMMLPALTIVVIAFVFKEVNDQLGLPNFVIANVAPLMTPLLFPVITFSNHGTHLLCHWIQLGRVCDCHPDYLAFGHKRWGQHTARHRRLIVGQRFR